MEEHLYLKQMQRGVWAGDVSTYKQVRAMKEENMAIKHNDNIHTKGIEVIPETDLSGKTTWMFRFTRVDDSRQSSAGYSGPFEALAEALHTLRREGEASTWQEYLMKVAETQKRDGKLDEYGNGIAEISENHVVISHQNQKMVGFAPVEAVRLTPAQALSLRDWLTQNTPELERLAKEQAGEQEAM